MSNIPETGRTPRVTIRLVILQILVMSMLFTLGGRLWYLQVRNGEEYERKAAGNHVQQVVKPAVRGSILDTHGVPIADNETRLVVSASRTALLKMDDDGAAVLTRLAKLLDMPVDDVKMKVRLCDAKTPQPCWNGSPYQPIPITDEATTQQALSIRERAEDFPGITAEPTALRRYPAPYGANTSQVLGYLSPVTDEEIKEAEDGDSPFLPSDQVGRSGLERTYNKELRGDAGVTRYEVDNLGRVMGQTESQNAVSGSHLVTSLDARVQAVAEKELYKAMLEARKQNDRNTGRNYEADAGAVVVMEAKTGRVVAMASNPEYDPNAWVGGIDPKTYEKITSKKSNYPLLNRTIQGQAAPGSIFKVVSSAAAVQSGHDWDDPVPCPSSYSTGNQVFKNFESRGYGSITLGKALEVSCDSVYYKLAHDEWKRNGGTKPKKDATYWFHKTAKQFGLSSETGVDLPNEVPGRIPDSQWKKDYWKANKGAWCKQAEQWPEKKSYAVIAAREGCLEGFKLHAYDMINYSIGQGDTLVTPLQMATIYGAISNGGTMYHPTLGKAVVSPDGKDVKEIEPRVRGKLPMSEETLGKMDAALRSVITDGSAAWRFGGWPQKEIPLRAKTGTAEVFGKQTTSWFATYTDDYTIVMTISQGGTGSGASGPFVRNIYNAIYGIDAKGTIDKRNALLPEPDTTLPKIDPAGQIVADKDKDFAAREKRREKAAAEPPTEVVE